ncbi:MAG: hypothetical protein QXD03_02380 [Candidatus Anstonellales archaeon]
MINDSYEYVVCNKLYRIKYLLDYFNRSNNSCYCKSKLYECISRFSIKLIIHSLCSIDRRVIPDRYDIFNEYCEYVESVEDVSEFLASITNNIIRSYYDLLYDEYTRDMKYLIENHDVESFSNFIDNIIDKFFENVLIMVSGFNIKCSDNCIGRCRKCNLSTGNVIKFYLFDEFVVNKGKLLDLIRFIESNLDCKSIDVIVDGKFLYDSNCTELKDIYNHIRSIFKSVELSGLPCDE